MTIAELKAIIKDLPDDMLVCYDYDTGNAYSTFDRGVILKGKRFIRATKTCIHVPFFCLTEHSWHEPDHDDTHHIREER